MHLSAAAIKARKNGTRTTIHPVILDRSYLQDPTWLDRYASATQNNSSAIKQAQNVESCHVSDTAGFKRQLDKKHPENLSFNANPRRGVKQFKRPPKHTGPKPRHIKIVDRMGSRAWTARELATEMGKAEHTIQHGFRDMMIIGGMVERELSKNARNQDVYLYRVVKFWDGKGEG